MSTPTGVERELGQAIDLASFEQYLQRELRPLIESFLDTIEGHEWTDLIEGAFNQFTTMVALAQIAPTVPELLRLGKAIAASSEGVIGAILLSLAVKN